MHKIFALKMGTLAFGVANLALCATAASVPAQSQSLPGQSQSLPAATAVPVSFVHTVDAKKAKVGDKVTAKTMQVILLPGGASIDKGTVVVGHVVAVQPFHFDPTPYVHQSPSLISIHFDELHKGDSVIPVSLSVRAIADTEDSRQASYPHSNVDADPVGMMTLIGGTSYSPLDKMIQSDDGDAIGYNRKGGVFARLSASGSSGKGQSIHCEATDTEQSLAIFSPDACGMYGFSGDYILENGQDGSGTFTLAVRGRSEKLYAGSTALLQVNQAK
jgi:hypothetical protein